MPRISLPPILRWAALCGYVLLVALGHGGWHLALGEASCGSHASHSPQMLSGKATCCHGHRHPGRGTSAPDPAQSPVPHAPHNSDDCAVCAVFSAPLTLTEILEISLHEVAAISSLELHIAMEPSTQERLYSPRGPPAC